ncbi:PQQ-binding-like beta-propeller repeat protein [Haloterrigena salifodinae]|uniref:PQQ-binding-like beta-propeller repeat protein n=1 Tax=Haloterrigena salifodinae TaxID=2675099 RepID=A0A8T8E1F4_9EURY|nr:sister chromatid cohesion protein PDS5 [Haloterrigena salifodinae]QRV15589.1 PQQ-binding-like beta-propeller repeat protein [Haloterrigena salifodinae]
MSGPDEIADGPGIGGGDGIEVTVGIDQLEEFLAADDPDVREYAARTLATKAAERPADVRSAVPSLTDRLEDEPSIRSHAAAALSAVAADHPGAVRESIPALTDRLESEARSASSTSGEAANATVRASAADALAAVATEAPAAVADSIEALGRYATDGNERVRVRTTDALAAVADAQPERVVAVVDDVAAAADDETAAVRENATAVLAAVATAAPDAVLEAVPALVDRLEDEMDIQDGATASADAGSIGGYAMEALRAIADDSPAAVADAVDPIAAHLADDREGIRHDAALALESIATDRPGAVVDAVDRLAGRLDDTAAIRRECVDALREIAAAEPADVASATAALVARLDDPLEAVRTDAAETLASVAAERPTAITDAVRPLARRLETDVEPVQRHGITAIAAVADTQPDAVEPVVTELAAVADADDESVRLDAVRAIAAVAASSPDAIGPVVPALADRIDDPHEPVRRPATDALAALVRETRAEGTDVSALLEALEGEAENASDEGDEWVQGYAARGIADIARSATADAHPAVRSLTRRLDDDATAVRRAATRDLVTVAAERPLAVRGAVGPLAERLGGEARSADEDATVRNNAAIVLSRVAASTPDDVREDDVLVSLLAALDDPDRSVRRTVRRTLAEIASDTGDDDCRPTLSLAVAETTAEAKRVRVAACEALATLGLESGAEAEAVVEALRELLVDPTPAVRAAALDALETTLAADADIEPTPTDVVLESLSGDGDRSAAVAAALGDVVQRNSESVAAAVPSLLERFAPGEADTPALLRALTTVVAADGGDASTVTGALVDWLDADGDRRAIVEEIARLTATAPDDAAAERDRLADLLAERVGDTGRNGDGEADDEAVRGYAALALGTLAVTGHDDGSALESELEAVDDRLLDAASLAAGGETPTHTDGINTQLSGMGDRLDAEPWVAGLAVLALAVLADESATLRPTGIGKIAGGLEADGPVVRVTAGRVLETMADDDPSGFADAVPALLAALEDSDADVRAAAAGALAACAESDDDSPFEDADRNPVPVLESRLADPDGRVRARAVRTLAALEATAAKPDVEPLADDPVPAVATAAEEATTRLADATDALPDSGDGDGDGDAAGWPMARAGPSRVGRVTDGSSLGRRPAERWRDDPEDAAPGAAPAVVGETVVVGRDDGSVAALALEDGRERWRFETGGPVRTAPAVADGAVYVGSADGAVYAIDAESGEREWRYQTDGRVETSPVVADGVVYACSDDLHAIDAENGRPVWTAALEGECSGPTVADDAVYVATGDRLHSLATADGSRRWERTFEAPIGAPPAVADGTVYVTSGETLLALSSADGSRRFRFDTGARIETPPAVSSADGTAYAASSDGSLYAVETARGTERWRVDVGTATTGPAVVGEAVYLGTDDGRLLALTAGDGRRRWRLEREATATELAVSSATLWLVDDGVAALGGGRSSLTESLSGLFTRFGGDS